MTPGFADPFIRRLERDTVIVLLVMAGVAFAWRPLDYRLPLGVLGGGLLMAVSYWGVRGGVDALLQASAATAGPPVAATKAGPARIVRFVKFFTRHAILALAAYAMIARLHLDAVGMLAGVTSPGIAAVAELIRATRAARFAGRGSDDSRSS